MNGYLFSGSEGRFPIQEHDMISWHVLSLVFLIAQAWFGVVMLARGLLLSLPSVVVPDSPNVQLVLMHSVILVSLVPCTNLRHCIIFVSPSCYQNTLQ